MLGYRIAMAKPSLNFLLEFVFLCCDFLTKNSPHRIGRTIQTKFKVEHNLGGEHDQFKVPKTR